MHLVNTYIDRRVTRGEIVKSSADNGRHMLRQWHRHAGPIGQWTNGVVLDWIHGPDWNLRPNARKGRRTTLLPYLRWLHAEGHTPTDLGYDVPGVKVPRRPPRNLPTGDVSQLLAACPDLRARLIVILMVQCGVRCSSVAWALIEDFDLERRTFAVREKGGRGEVTNEVALPDEAALMLVQYLDVEGRCSGPLLRNSRRVEPTPVSAGHVVKLVNRWVLDAGLKSFPRDGVSAHALRHTCAQDMFDQGATIEEVQHTLGHKNKATTEDFYVNTRPESLATAMGGRTYLPQAA